MGPLRPVDGRGGHSPAAPFLGLPAATKFMRQLFQGYSVAQAAGGTETQENRKSEWFTDKDTQKHRKTLTREVVRLQHFAVTREPFFDDLERRQAFPKERCDSEEATRRAQAAERISATIDSILTRRLSRIQGLLGLYASRFEQWLPEEILRHELERSEFSNLVRQAALSTSEAADRHKLIPGRPPAAFFLRRLANLVHDAQSEKARIERSKVAKERPSGEV